MVSGAKDDYPTSRQTRSHVLNLQTCSRVERDAPTRPNTNTSSHLILLDDSHFSLLFGNYFFFFDHANMKHAPLQASFFSSNLSKLLFRRDKI